MTPGRAAAYTVRTEAERGRRLDRAFGEIAPTLSEQDRAFAHELAWGTTRMRGRLDDALASHLSRPLDEVDAPVLELLRLGAYQILFMDGVPPYAAVSATVDQVRAEVGARPTGFVNAVLRKVVGHTLEPDPVDESPEALAAWGSHPLWLVRRWVDRYGAADTRRLLDMDNRRPPTCIVPLDETPDDALSMLAAAGVEAERAAPWSPCLRLAASGQVGAALEALPASIVQDPASNLVARYADVSPGTIVADLCAAPGGKSLALSDRPARIIAADRSDSRMSMVRENALRTGRRMDFVVADAARPCIRPVDCVLLDAPCTGTGTLARHPDARWRLEPGSIHEMAALQSRMLEAAASVVRPGGLLVYSTCTLEPEENDRPVAAFMERHPEFRLEPSPGLTSSGDGAEDFVDGKGYLRVLPWRSGYDGAFAARLRKTA